MIGMLNAVMEDAFCIGLSVFRHFVPFSHSWYCALKMIERKVDFPDACLRRITMYEEY